jgi:hypothetical protein
MLMPRSLPGMKTKAAQTGVLLRLATAFCEEFGEHIQRGALLAEAGRAMLEYMRIIRNNAFRVPWDQCQLLMHLCRRHLALMEACGVKFLPKAHQWVHMTSKVRTCGNPRLYSCFLDEGLNLVLALMAKASHRTRWHLSIFTRVRLLPHVVRTSAFAAL